MANKRLIESEQYTSDQLNVSNWSSVFIDNLTPKDKETFLKRQQAIQLFISGSITVNQITNQTGIHVKTLRRLLRRCLSIDSNGEVWGYRGLIPNKTITKYERKDFPNGKGNPKLTGAFHFLLDRYPSIKETIDLAYLKRGKQSVLEPAIRIKHLHKKFLDACRNAGLTPSDYPFNTVTLAKRSLERYVKTLEHEHFNRAAKRYGDEASQLARSTGIPTTAPMVIRPYERVQFDGHRIDAIFAIVYHTPEGDEIVEVLERIWLLVIIDVATRVVIGYYLSLNKEYSASDVLQCIRNAVVPKKNKKLTISGLRFREDGGYASNLFPGTCWALWDELLYDNGKANLAKIVNDRLTHIVGSSVNAGPVALPVRRGYIERFFGTLEENGFHRLPNTTGSHLKDPRRQSPEAEAIKYRITFEHLEELTDVLISDYNGTPHEGLNNLSPLEVMSQRLEKGCIPRVMPEEKRNDVHFLALHAKRTVVGNVKEGRRPFINYEGVEYRSEVLSRCPEFIGIKLDLIVNMDDLRVIQAFLPDGSEFGALTASGKWGITPHSLQVRMQINKLRHKKLLHYTSSDDPIQCYQRYLEENAKHHRKSRNKLADLKKMTQIPTKIDTPFQKIIEVATLKQTEEKDIQTPIITNKIFKTFTY
jgi:hypothetical protein